MASIKGVIGFLCNTHWFRSAIVELGDAASFLTVYAAAAYFFFAKMVRLIILLEPIAS